MRYMYLIYTTPEMAAAPPPARLMEEIGKLSAAQTKMLSGGGLTTIDRSVRASVKGGKLTLTDGPFAESKEVMGGYAIFEHETREEAIESMRQFMELHRLYGDGWEGVCEMREMMDGPPAHA
ncbi:MAG: hypothetical protein HY054_05220 [Proteobacteria bacterium]|nr:hypothetical protein [Pseudomonadota bacterium]